MPPPKKSTTRSTTAKKGGKGSITRREVEAATKRFDKALDDAGTALQTMGSNLGRNAKSSYREIESALKTLRRDATKANRTVLKDLEKVWAAAGSATTATRSRSTRSTAKSAAAKSTASKPRSTAAKSRTAAKSTATKRSATSDSKSSRGS